MSDAEVDQFYERTSWPIGTVVCDPDDPTRLGHIVARGGRIWVNRDKLPMVRWHGKIDAVPVPWENLCRPRDIRAATTEDEK